MELKRIMRHTLPTKYDSADYGTLCECFIDDNKPRLYIQLSKNEDPHWEPIGYLCERAFESIFDNDDFLIALLDMIETDSPDFSLLYGLLHK